MKIFKQSNGKYNIINLAVLIVFSLFYGCERIDMDDATGPGTSYTPVPKSSEADFNVSLKTARYFAGTQNPDKKLKSIEPLVYLGDTVMYIVNYADNGGWLVLAGDKRFEPILTIHEKGNFTEESTHPGLDVWFENIAENISYVKKHNLGIVNQEGYNIWAMMDKAANITPEVQAYFDKKYGIIPKEHYDLVEEDGRTVAKIKPQYTGYYASDYVYLVKKFVSATSSPTRVTKNVSLLPVKWGQSDPFNTNLPYVRNQANNGWVKPVAGCSAIAMAQTLYSLHNHIGKPNGLFHLVSYTGYIWDSKNYQTSFSRDQYNANSTRWNEMATRSWNNYNNYVADLVSDICIRLGTSFSYNGSGANINSGSFNSWSITADQTGYNGSTVLAQLKSNKPVLMTAYATKKTSGIWPFRSTSYSDGHAWVFDGYVEKTTTYTYTYRWELATRCPQDNGWGGYYYDPYYPCDPYYTYPNDDPYDPCGRPCDSYVYTGSSYDGSGNEIDWNGNHYPGQTETSTNDYVSTYVTINWGWFGSYDGEYSPWASNHAGGGYTFQYIQEIIYNFR